MKELSIFVDESGDFGEYAKHSPFYIITMILHDQSQDISGDIAKLRSEFINLGYEDDFVVHTGPLIRKEEIYCDMLPNDRRAIFTKLYFFTLKANIWYEKKKKVYHYLNAFGLTPWIALHLIYVVILSLFAWLNNNGFSKDALLICESLFDNYSWLIPVCEGLMLPVFLYWFYVQITGNTIFKKGMAFTNVLVIFGILKGISMMMPESGFRLGFTNGLMSEIMIIWFLLVFMEIGGRK